MKLEETKVQMAAGIKVKNEIKKIEYSCGKGI
jgi:hypothetical protein